MILSIEDLRKIRPLGENINDTKRILPYIEEVEQIEIIPLIGAALYKQLSCGVITDAKLTDEVVTTILEGGYYEHCNEERYHSGLKRAIAQFVYARFILANQVNATAFGVTRKLSEFSEPIDAKTISIESRKSVDIGNAYMRGVVDYLKSIQVLKSECFNKKISYKSKFKVIGR